MRVMMTADAVGGVWGYVTQLAGRLSRRGADVLIATMGPPPSESQRAEAETHPRVSVHVSERALEWMPQAWPDVDRAGDWLLGLESAFKPDIVHLNGYAHAPLAWKAPTLVVAHSCVSSWWEAVHGCSPPAEWDEYVKRAAAGLMSATAVAAPTRAMADAITRLYGLQRYVHVIPNARDARQWTSSAKDPFVLAAGRLWDQAKNVAALDAVAPDVPWPIVVAGEEAGPDATVHRCEHARTVGRCSSDEMARLMSRASIYALPARYEPFGLSVLEAALAGCTLVLGDISSLRENWSGVACFVHPERHDDLRRVLQTLIADPDRRRTLAHAARRRAEHFSPDAQATAYEHLYGDMVATHARVADSTWALRRGRAVAGGPPPGRSPQRERS